MKKQTLKRTERLPEIRLYPSEKAALEAEFSASFYPSKSDFIRTKILDKKYSAYRQKRFEAEIAAGKLADALNQISQNLHQLMQKNQLDFQTELASILQLLQEIKTGLSKNDKL